MRRHVLVPLGMRSSTLQKPLVTRRSLPARTTPIHRPEPGWSPVFPYNRPHAASSTLLSNVEDMSRWAQRTWDTARSMAGRSSTRELRQLWRPTVATGRSGGRDRPQPHRIELVRGGVPGPPLVSHSGGDVGYLSFVGLAPD